MFIFALIVGAIGVILLQGLRKIKPSPPHLGQGTWLGEKVPEKVYEEGWGFYLGYPYIFGFIPIKVERITLDVASEKTRTPDRAESKVPVFLTIRPDRDHLIEYIDSGQEPGVKHQLGGKIQERIREWASGPEEGPATWVELNQSHLEAVSVLVKQIAGNSLTPIPNYAQPVPTWIWLRYFAQPRPTKFLKNEKPWAKNNWAKVRAVLENIVDAHGPNAVNDLQTAVEGRRKDIEALRTGTGKIVLCDLGVILERLNLGDIDVLGNVATKAEEEAKEEQERLGEARELGFVRERMEELMGAPFNFSASEARDLVQTERGKVVRAIDDKRIALDKRTAEVVESIGTAAVAAILGRKQ